MKRLFIYAPNIHQGGGKTLLAALLGITQFNAVFLVTDSRMTFAVEPKVAHWRKVTPSVQARLQTEFWLSKIATKDDVVLCFGNLPPIFKSRARVVVFLHNRYLVSGMSLTGLSLRTRTRLRLERLWFRHFSRNVDEFLVQTPSMKSALERTLGVACNTASSVAINIKPVVDSMAGYARRGEASRAVFSGSDFVYVASGDAHKNHRHLIDAWCLLAQEGFFPSLVLTIDSGSFADLCNWITEQSRVFKLRISNLGVIGTQEVAELYASSGALIYPSVFESFGLPLIEARQVGLPIIASEMDYVRDILDPADTFDPTSPTSIARAVKRFKGLDEDSLGLLDASGFLAYVSK